MKVAVLASMAVITLVAMPSGERAFRPAIGREHVSLASVDSLEELYKARLAKFTDINKILDSGFSAGEVTLDRVIESRNQMLTAQLDLCSKKEERIAVRSAIVESAKEMQQAVQKRAAAHEIYRVDVLTADAQLIQAQIDLELEKQSQ